MTSPRSFGNSIVIVLAIAFLLRCTVIWLQPASLMTDPDAYVALAGELADGNGYISPETGEPTAYRPPLYPLTLTGVLSLAGFEHRVLGIGLWHALLGTITVAGTYLAARRLGFRRGAVMAALLITVDPLLLQYTTVPMTETLCTALVTGLLVVLLSQRSTDPAADSELTADSTLPSPVGDGDSGDALALPFEQRWSVWTQAGIGLLFGLAVMCRPTVWMWGLLLAVWFTVRGLRARGLAGVWHFWPAILAAILTVAPWAIRNHLVFGRPVLTTTHGGYTLLLGNNEVFARDVVAQPWGTTWGGDSLREWQQSLEAEMAAADPPVRGELARDHWMADEAREFMTARPATTGQAGWLRLRRLWNPIPLPPATAAIHRAAERFTGRLGLAAPEPVVEMVATGLRWLIILLHGGLGVAAIIALFRIDRSQWSLWAVPLLLLAAFTLVHFFYWSNTRMRAPLMPAVVLFAIRGLQFRGRANGRSEAATPPTPKSDAAGTTPVANTEPQAKQPAATTPEPSRTPPADQSAGTAVGEPSSPGRPTAEPPGDQPDADKASKPQSSSPPPPEIPPAV